MSHNQPNDQRRGMQSNPGGEESYSTPRRPMPDTEARLLSGAPRANTVPASKSSSLSVNAPEFVPKSHTTLPGSLQDKGPEERSQTVENEQYGTVNSANYMYHSYGYPNVYYAMLLSPSAPEFVPGSGFVPRSGLYPPDSCPPSQPQYHPRQHQGDDFVDAFNQMHVGGAEDLTAYLLNEFQNTMLILVTQPGNIPEYMRPLCEKLQRAGTPEVLNQVVDILYQQSVYESNFRYTGARVCHYMCNHLRDHPIFGQFKGTFLNKCQQDYNNRQQLLTGQDGLETLCGLTLFMGELFLNVTVEQGGQTERLDFLPSALTDLMLTLLTNPVDVSVKTVCQLLKLAGGPVEDRMKQDPQKAQIFSNIFSALTALKSSPQLAPNMKALIESVLKFRSENWGRSQQPLPSNSPAQPRHMYDYAQGIQAEPIFFNMHGKQITREEAGYEDEGDLDDGSYVLTEDEEREFLAWQAETTAYGGQMTAHQDAAIPNQRSRLGYEAPAGYQAWSTDDGYGDFQASYGYDDYVVDNGYSPYLPDGLTMDEEAEQAYEDFLNAQSMRK